MRSRTRALAAFAAGAVATVSVGGALGLWPVQAPATAQPESGRDISAGAPGASGVDADIIAPMLTLVGAATRDMEGLVGQAGRRPVQGSAAFRGEREQADSTAVPARSGKGRRVVFDMSAQRVWLVRADDSALRSYPVSGSRLDNLSPGTYEVYSRSRHATSYTYDETMQYMVRFTRGENAAIGFHDIPLDHRGEPVQTVEQLGEPLSSGCIRQRRRDAKTLWEFAPEGTQVVVVA